MSQQISAGLRTVPLAVEPLNRKDFTTDQEVRWCPGCGDYAILATFQGLMPQLGIKRENTVIVSGIGCSSRFPYYVDSYGMHSIHGRAPAIATGLAMAREDLAVWVVTGDGDALSIGGNHLIHALRRNVNITIILFNNRIYGLTKGQYSPTSETGKVTKSTPAGSVDTPFNPVSLALGAEASFVARTVDSHRAHLTEVLGAAISHRGASLVEIYQNCPIFNDGAFDGLKGPDSGLIPLRHGEPIVFGPDNAQGIVRGAGGVLHAAPVAEVGLENVLVHDAHRADPGLAFELSRLTDAGTVVNAPVGIFRDVERPAYDDLARSQVTMADDPAERLAALQGLVNGPDTWVV
ncbi:MAG: 2-oxoacid:ferredoxin oxidoreductase subunit beta [Propionicimonas sp.]|uniref:2-oxoacid:ferredoxin oxidoreductase subunit beta n=1 Tax=Propionicimonas sp. TaxID=1955623 RepID=UPI002B1ED731|nr:2-oxoacid:ferredoxin oxidoreductase subunit beta [Propionicimonas sp.]MEA4945195.1 2-oxoacid:ferredoxin oxidoreductase subunit beta [Propionicimonas sp.]MEA5052846.1 2-oxoacid:ferredoxin oxidoreductase subunit beta [Propionicimonas sp.]MEA5119325.1 2-oxoacid:ferredoxin oxidoreductase subunit beta [Propionicimonas sp.]